MKTKVSSWALVLLSSMLIIFTLLCSGIALAYANGPGDSDYEDLWSEFFAPQAAESNQSNTSNALPEGVKIWKGNDPASEGSDYEMISHNRIWVKTENLRIEGPVNAQGLPTPVDAAIISQSSNIIHTLALQNLYLNYSMDHNAVLLYCSAPLEDEENATSFTLDIIGQCYLYQNNENLNNHAIFFENGDYNSDVVINGEEGSYLECYSYESDTVYMNKNPLVFSGNLTTVIYNEQDGGDAIDWQLEDQSNNNLTLKDNVNIGVGNTNTANETAINVGNLNVLGNSSLLAICNNASTRNMGAINVKGKFIVDTTGDVLINAYNAKSWQAVVCNNNLEINKCNSFQAYAQDYSAVEVGGTLTIGEDAIENVYFSGGFVPTDGRARRGAFTVEHPDRLVIPEGYLLYGNEALEAEVADITQRAVVTFSSGTDGFDIYTPVIPDWVGLAAPKYAHSVVFREHGELIFVPGKQPTYSTAGYKDCYKFKGEDVYFEDYEQQRQIDNIDAWRSEGGDGYLSALRPDFDDYRNTVLAQCDSMLDRGDRPEIATLVNSAKAKINNYVYDNSVSLLSNKIQLDNIYKQLEADADALVLPVPEPWIPPTPVNPEVNPGANGTALTGDGFPFWAGILLALVAAAAGIVAWRKRELIKAKLAANGSTSSVAKTGFIVTLFGSVIVPIMLLLGLVTANAGTNTQAPSSSEGINNMLFVNLINKQFSDEPYPGISVTKDGQPASLGVDYAVDTTNKFIEIKNSGLTITGGTQLNPVEVSIFTDQNVRDLTINNLHVKSQKRWDDAKLGHTLYIDWEWKAGQEWNFTLNVKGECDLSQTGVEGGCAIDIVNEQGHGCNIHGDANSTLNCYATFYEAIFNHTGPLQISGDLTAYLKANRDNCIGWKDDAHSTDILALTDHVNLTCYASAANNYSAIEAGSFGILHNASLYVVNNNASAKDVATVGVKHYFGINTTGSVLIGNINEKSWQAIRCETLSILNCAQFLAFSSDYCAIECTNSITINTPNVIICGEFNREQTEDRARRGAVTIKDPSKIYIAADILAFGSTEAYNVEDTNNLAFMVKTIGTDVPADEPLYTSVVSNGNFATIAKTLTFARVSHNLELIPGSEPSYSNPGHREYYHCKACGYYFEDMSSKYRILDLESWISEGRNGYIAPLSADFEPYRAKMIEACNNMYIRADVPEIHALVETAQTLISGYTYNEAESMAANKAMLDKVYYQLLDKVNSLQL